MKMMILYLDFIDGLVVKKKEIFSFNFTFEFSFEPNSFKIYYNG